MNDSKLPPPISDDQLQEIADAVKHLTEIARATFMVSDMSDPAEGVHDMRWSDMLFAILRLGQSLNPDGGFGTEDNLLAIELRRLNLVEKAIASDLGMEIRNNNIHGFPSGKIRAKLLDSMSKARAVIVKTLERDEQRAHSDATDESEAAGVSPWPKPRPRSKDARNFGWYDWYYEDDADTYHSPAAIRDRWNRENQDAKIEDGQGGADVVSKGIKSVRPFRGKVENS